MFKCAMAMLMLLVKGEDAEPKKIQPPESGKFFYVDFPQFSSHGQHAVSVKILNRDGESFESYPLYVTMAQQGIAMLDTNCPSKKCQFSAPGRPYDWQKSKTYQLVKHAVRQPPAVAVYDKGQRELQPIAFYGITGRETFVLEYKNYERETSYTTEFLQMMNYHNTRPAAEGEDQTFLTTYTGFIGLQPYTNDETKKEQNFLWNLKKAGYIDHLTVAFYVHNDDRDKEAIKSTIKFGSIDSIGLKNAQRDITLLRTQHKGTWDLRCSQLKLDTEYLAEDSIVRIEPQLPYLYLPEHYYAKFKEKINKRYGSEVCPPDKNYCKFDKLCSSVDKNVNRNFMFTIYDEVADVPFSLDWNEMFMSGIFFGDQIQTCYITVFDHGLTGVLDSNVIIVGNLFMRHYYLVYDMSPLEYGEDYIQVAIGLQAPENLIGEKQYNPDSPHYKPYKKEFD